MHMGSICDAWCDTCCDISCGVGCPTKYNKKACQKLVKFRHKVRTNIGPWRPQDDCTVSCGHGTRNEARDVTDSSLSAPCTAAPTTREATCYAGPCPCAPQNWYNDGGCSVSSNCGVGTQFQRRDLVGDCAESTLKARERWGLDMKTRLKT